MGVNIVKTTSVSVAILALLIFSVPAFAESKGPTTVDTSRAAGVSIGLQSTPNSAVGWTSKGALSWWLSNSFGISGGVVASDNEYANGFQMSEEVRVSFDLLAIYALRVGETTRLNLEAGVHFMKSSSETHGQDGAQPGPTSLALGIPVGIFVEHFFSPTIAVSVGASWEVLHIEEVAFSSSGTTAFGGIDTSKMAMRLTWYTD